MSTAPIASDLRQAAAEFRRLAESMDAGADYADARRRDFQAGVEPILLAPATPTNSRWAAYEDGYSGRSLTRTDVARRDITWHAKSPYGPRPRYRHPTRWEGHETLFDSTGREWVRIFEAVIDDFGNLVEVAS